MAESLKLQYIQFGFPLTKSVLLEKRETKVKTICNKGHGWKAPNTATSAATILNHRIT